MKDELKGRLAGAVQEQNGRRHEFDKAAPSMRKRGCAHVGKISNAKACGFFARYDFV